MLRFDFVKKSGSGSNEAEEGESDGEEDSGLHGTF